MEQLWTSDPDLKYAEGILKGKPLTAAGLPYRVIKHQGEEVALFQNGAMARFYRDCPHPLDQIIVGTGIVGMRCKLCGEEGEHVRSSKLPEQGGIAESLPKSLPPEDDEFPALLVKSPYPRQTLAAFRKADGSRPMHPCDAAYAFLEDGHALYNFSRETVGEGLREFIWLYEKLRELGRGRPAAFLEAWKIYYV